MGASLGSQGVNKAACAVSSGDPRPIPFFVSGTQVQGYECSVHTRREPAWFSGREEQVRATQKTGPRGLTPRVCAPVPRREAGPLHTAPLSQPTGSWARRGLHSFSCQRKRLPQPRDSPPRPGPASPSWALLQAVGAGERRAGSSGLGGSGRDRQRMRGPRMSGGPGDASA